MDARFVNLYVCPQNRLPLALAEPALLAGLNAAIAVGGVRNQAGRPVRAPLQQALVRSDRRMLYPVVNEIPLLLPQEAIAFDQLKNVNLKS